MVERHVVTYFSGFANDDTCTVIDEKAPPNLCARVNVDIGDGSGNKGQGAWQEAPTALPERMGEPLNHDCVQTRIQRQHFKACTRRWVAGKYAA
jgi:hypothetical protein